MLPLLTPTTLSPTLIHLHLLPPALVASIHASYALLPPTPRWYNILLSVTSRGEGDSADCAAGGRNDGAGVVVAVEKRGRKGRDGVARSVEGLQPRKDGQPGELAASRWEDIGSLSELKAPPTSQTTEVRGPDSSAQSPLRFSADGADHARHPAEAARAYTPVVL
jgi:hypothetical protein